MMSFNKFQPFGFHLQGKIVSAIRSIIEACWEVYYSKLQKLSSMAFRHTTTATGVELLWNDLPVKPELKETEEKRALLINYATYIDGLGTLKSIQLAKEIFNLSKLEVIEMRENKYSAFYPFHFLRIRCDFSSEQQQEKVKQYVRSSAPARSIFHIHYTPTKSSK